MRQFRWLWLRFWQKGSRCSRRSLTSTRLDSSPIHTSQMREVTLSMIDAVSWEPKGTPSHRGWYGESFQSNLWLQSCTSSENTLIDQDGWHPTQTGLAVSLVSRNKSTIYLDTYLLTRGRGGIIEAQGRVGLTGYKRWTHPQRVFETSSASVSLQSQAHSQLTFFILSFF